MHIGDDKPGLSRFGILAAILLCWGGGLIAMGRRQAADHTDANRLAAAAARVTPQDIYFRVEQDGHQIGFAASRLDTIEGGFYLADYIMVDRWVPVQTPRGTMARIRRTTLTSRVWLSNTFRLRRYMVLSDTGAGETVIVELTNTGKAFNGRDYRNEYCFVFEIEGELWTQPVPQQLFLETSIELETRLAVVTDARRRG